MRYTFLLAITIIFSLIAGPACSPVAPEPAKMPSILGRDGVVGQAFEKEVSAGPADSTAQFAVVPTGSDCAGASQKPTAEELEAQDDDSDDG